MKQHTAAAAVPVTAVALLLAGLAAGESRAAFASPGASESRIAAEPRTAAEPRAADTPTRAPVIPTPAEFASQAAAGGMAEIQLAELAKQRAQSDAVREFAERMIVDHGKTHFELQALARSKSITLPNDLKLQHEAAMESLARMSGARFDEAYMALMEKDHLRSVALYEAASDPGFRDADLRGFAAKTLPVLQQHQAMVERVQRSLPASR